MTHIGITMSKYSHLFNVTSKIKLLLQALVNKERSFRLTGILFSLLCLYSRKYLLKYYSFFFDNISIEYKIMKQLSTSFIVPHSPTNVSSPFIDRSSINFKQVLTIMKEKYDNKCRFYYLRLLNHDLLANIKSYMSNYAHKDYVIHEYERRNKINIPITIYTRNQTASNPTTIPNRLQLARLETFVEDTSYHVIPKPSAPDYHNPAASIHTQVLQPYFGGIYIPYSGNPPIKSYDEVVTEIEALYPNKKYLDYERYRDITCFFCGKKGHPIRLCEDIVNIENILDPELYRLANFINYYPRNKILQRYGSYSDIIWTLPQVYEQIERDCKRFWSDYGYSNPFADVNKYWLFGDHRSRDIGFWWAIGSSKVYLLKLIIGYESKYCRQLPRMQLKNHKSINENLENVLETLDEYLQLGITKIIPKSAANVILPMAAIVKPNKTRIVIDAKPINSYLPSMKFRPDKIEMVKSTVFQNARVGTQDGMHAFFQLKVPPQQALNQCVEIYYPPLRRKVVFAFVTEIFGGKNSCYRYKKLEDQINGFFRKVGIQMNDFYDDSVFYAQDSDLSMGVLGAFIKRIYYRCGRLLNESKTNLLNGLYKFKFCGFSWDSHLMQYAPLQKLIDSTLLCIDNLISCLGTMVRIKQLVQVMGKLSYSGLALHHMSVLLIPLKEIMRSLHHKYGQDEIWQQLFYVTQYLVNHLEYLRDYFKNQHIVPITIDHWDYDIISDVSDNMAGSYDSDSVSYVIPLPQHVKSCSSTLRETYGIYVALVNRLDKLKGKTVRVIVDNLGTSTIIMRNGSKLLELNKLVYKIVTLCIENNITIWVRWLRRDSDAVQFADDLSKCVEKDRWLFDEELLNNIIMQLNTPSITLDLLADNENSIVRLYYSRYFDGWSLGVNWMSQPYKSFVGHISYLNPPFRTDYLEVCVKHILYKHIITYILVPVWPAASWYQQLIRHAKIIVTIPNGTDYFSSPSYYTARIKKQWDVILVYVDHSQPIKTLLYKYNSFLDCLQKDIPLQL